MRIKKKDIKENIEKAEKIAKDGVKNLEKNLEPVSQSIRQDVEAITGDPERAKEISDEMAASAIYKAYSNNGDDDVVSGVAVSDSQRKFIYA